MEANISFHRRYIAWRCNHRTDKKGLVSYFHRAIFPVIVAPGHENVLALAPEFITPQDGHEKQDSEQAAAGAMAHSS